MHTLFLPDGSIKIRSIRLASDARAISYDVLVALYAAEHDVSRETANEEIRTQLITEAKRYYPSCPVRLEARIKRFDAEQGMVARRNARKAYSTALSALRKAVDEEYPIIRKPPKRTGRLSVGVRRRRLEDKGLVRVVRDVWLPIRAAGVAVVKDPATHDARKKAEKVDHENETRRLAGEALLPRPRIPLRYTRWAPKWAVEFQTILEPLVLRPGVTSALWERAKKRGTRQLAEAELYLHQAVLRDSMPRSYRREATKRIREDRGTDRQDPNCR